MSIITFFIGLIIVIVVCSFIWWGIPILLPDQINVRNKQRIAILVSLVVVLVWLGGGFGGFSAPWIFYDHRK